MVIVYAGGKCPVQIKGAGKRYTVHALKKIECVEMMYADPMKSREKRCKFVFDKKRDKSGGWGGTFKYKPYEERDVSKDVTSIYSDAKRWCPSKVSWHIPTTMSASKARSKGFTKRVGR